MREEQKLSDFKLRIGYWVVTNKIFIKRFIIFILFSLDVLLVSFSSYRFIQFYSVERVQYEKIMSGLVSYNIDYSTYWKKIKPQEMQILELDSVSLSGNKYNFVAKVRNPNINKWVAREIEYYFVYNNQKTEIKKSFLLPGEDKFLGAFNVESSSKILKPSLQIANIKWRRIKKGDLEEFLKKVDNFTDFTITEKQFLTATELGLEGGSRTNAVRFLTRNNTIYDYYDIGFFVVTYNGPIITSANYLTLNTFLSNETREAEMRWHEPISRPSLILVEPEVDFFDETVIIGKDDSIGNIK